MVLRKFTMFMFVGITIITLANIVSCSDDDVVDEPDPGTSTTELLAKIAETPPTIDGSIDAGWEKAQKLVVTASVPNVDFDNFKGYVGSSYNVTMRALYDDQNIYFLAEWADSKEDLSRQTWYFDSADKLWKQESRYPTFDGNDNMIRKPFYEDKFAMLWNVNNSVSDWASLTCFSSCHAVQAEEKVRHYTREGETIDMWHWKSVRTDPNNQADDQYQSWQDGDGNPLPAGGGNGRHSDDKASGGYTNNTQILNNGAGDVTVPLYFIPNKENYYWVTQNEIDNGTAKTITDVDEMGVLSYDGGTIDPNADTGFQRSGEDVGPKGIPSVFVAPFVGSRGDLTAKGVYTGNGWVLEMKRSLDTGEAKAQDVDFSSLEGQLFGIGVFDNSAIAHAIRAGLELNFEK